ncbi:MoaD/ThiS family protein [Candidatus Bathyarchaeota archaeon]|jgi:molybdopterin synthase sulfur carrier subunit|nr:MoaD/ThiS family protein [Candidatus Bathyarchaeota archaeon]
MSAKARFVGSLRSLSGEELVTLDLQKRLSLKEVMKRIVEERPKLNGVFAVSKPEKLRSAMLILVNGKEISVLNGLETTIKDGDELVFVPVLHGG